MDRQRTGCFDDPKELSASQICLSPISKNLRGYLMTLHRQVESCDDRRCETLKEDSVLKVEVASHEPCDAEEARDLDGTLYVRNLVSAFANGNADERGFHRGEFIWHSSVAEIRGALSGTTHTGTHREPAFDPCQECHAPGFMEGQLCGRILRAQDERLRGCSISASYRFTFDPQRGGTDSAISGTLEGLIICPCRATNCVDFTRFPAMAHANPWTVSGHQFLVLDHTGTPTSSADVVTFGSSTGLLVGFETRVALSATATTVELRLVHFSSPATVTAFDDAGNVVDTATMSAGGGIPEYLRLTGGGIVALTIEAPQNEALLLEICVS